MPMELPSLADLQGTYGAGDPEVYRQMQQNQGLAQMYQQQQLEQARNRTQEGFLKNQFDEQQNLQLLRQRRLENTGLENTNIIGGVNARRAVANEPMQLTQDQRKFALQATDDDLKAAEQHAIQESQTGDPVRMQQARKILDFTAAAIAEKRKEEAAMARQKEQTRSHLGGIGMQIGSQEKMENARIAAGKYDKTSKSSAGISNIQAAVQAGKMTAEKAAVALHGAAMFEPDPELAQKYKEMAGQYEQFAMNQRNAQAQGKPDIGAIAKLPTQNLPPALGAPAQPKVGVTKSGVKFKVVSE